MKTFFKAVTTAVLVFAIAGSATATPPKAGLVNQTVWSATGGNGRVYAHVHGDTVILRGFVDEQLTSNQVERAVSDLDGVNRVINRTFIR